MSRPRFDDRSLEPDPGHDATEHAAVGIARVGARMILLDPRDRVLLIEEAGHEDGVSWHHWLTPGGGVEADESLVDAAIREVVEETGLRVQLAGDAQAVHTQPRRWSWQGQTYDQTDHFFAARVGEAFQVQPAALTAMEQQTVLGARWWSVGDLSATTDTVIPGDLARIVAGLLERDELPRPLRRLAGRVLVLDGGGRVLLIKSRWGPDGSATNWVAPGGGVEVGETVALAAQRELFEETGIDADLGHAEEVTVERAVFTIGDWILDQSDHYFLWAVDQRPDIDRSRLTDFERRTVLEYRWWTAAELAATDEVFWPADLARVVGELAASMRTGGPVEPSTGHRSVVDRA